MSTCKNCKWKSPGFNGKPSTCSNIKMRVVDIWKDSDILPKAGIGYIDQYWIKETAHLYVGEDFGCVHYESVISTT